MGRAARGQFFRLGRSGGEEGFDEGFDIAGGVAAFEFGHDLFHHLADILGGGGLDDGDGLLDDGRRFFERELLGQIGFDDLGFFAFLLREVVAASVGVSVNAFLTAFDLFGEEAECFFFVVFAFEIDLFFFEIGEHHFERRGARFVLGFHGGFEVFRELSE